MSHGISRIEYSDPTPLFVVILYSHVNYCLPSIWKSTIRQRHKIRCPFELSPSLSNPVTVIPSKLICHSSLSPAWAVGQRRTLLSDGQTLYVEDKSMVGVHKVVFGFNARSEHIELSVDTVYSLHLHVDRVQTNMYIQRMTSKCRPFSCLLADISRDAHHPHHRCFVDIDPPYFSRLPDPLHISEKEVRHHVNSREDFFLPS
jgi:hypothetical protein